MELTTLPSTASQSGEPEEGNPASGGRRRIVPFVAKRAETSRGAERTAAKEPKAAQSPRPSTAPSSASTASAAPTDELPQTLVPLPRRPAAAAAAEPAAPAKGTPLKKDAFIRSFPSDVRASEIQAAGAAKGLVITVGYVHWVRSRAKAAESAATAQRPRSARSAKTTKPPVGAKAKAPARSPSAKVTPSPRPSPRTEPLGRAADPRLTGAVAAAAIASARMPNRQASERLILDTTARWVGLDRAIDILRTAQARVDLLLRP